MSDADWPAPEPAAPREPERRASALPRIEDLPIAEQGYDREKVREAFDAFYRHAAQLDATLATLEAVEVFQRTSAELRAELRTIRGSGWTVQSWHGGAGYGARGRVSEWSLPPAFPRVALEALFLIVIGVIVGVAGWSRLTIVLVMALALAVVWLIEWVAARERAVPHAPAPAAVPALDEEPEPSPEAEQARQAQEEGPEAMTMLGAQPVRVDEQEQAALEDVEPEPEPEVVAEAEPVAEDTAEDVVAEPERAEEPEPVAEVAPLEEPEPQPAPSEQPVSAAEIEPETAEEPPPPRIGLFRRKREDEEPEPPVVDFELPTEDPLVAAAETVDGEVLDGAAELDPWEQPPAIPEEEVPAAEAKPAPAPPFERSRARRRALPRRARRR